MLDAIKPLLDNGIINEETKQAIGEAWESRIVEAKEQVRAELREEFAQRYQHDKQVMVEALDKMVTESLTAELQEFADEKKQLAEDRVKFKQHMSEGAKKFNDFMVSKLAEEIKELRSERKLQMESQQKLEQFIVHALAREIKEFAQDKQAVVEAKVKLVAEGRKQLEALKAKFVTESAKRMNTVVATHLKGEISQLKEDIQVARENNFGRRIFEAYATEFGATHLNEKQEVHKLHDMLAQKDRKLDEAIQLSARAKALVESKERELRIIKESNERENTLGELLRPLNKEKQEVMRNLLESVQTPRLKNAFEKYLPAVLAENKPAKASKVIAESVTEVTGDKSARVQEDEAQTESNVFELKRLAGI